MGDFELAPGIYTQEDMAELAQMEQVCPYYVANRYLSKANIVVCTH